MTQLVNHIRSDNKTFNWMYPINYDIPQGVSPEIIFHKGEKGDKGDPGTGGVKCAQIELKKDTQNTSGNKLYYTSFKGDFINVYSNTIRIKEPGTYRLQINAVFTGPYKVRLEMVLNDLTPIDYDVIKSAPITDAWLVNGDVTFDIVGESGLVFFYSKMEEFGQVVTPSNLNNKYNITITKLS